MTNHKSDCAVHNEPAMKAGPCDCGAGIVEAIAQAIFESGDPHAKWDAITSWVNHPDDSNGFAKKEVEKHRGQARAALTAARNVLAENLLDKTAMQQIDDALGHDMKE